MDNCKNSKLLSKKVFDFIDNVSDVGEESITDYLVWKLREIFPRLNSLNVNKFNRLQENTVTGADFELELWILTNRKNFSFVFQAKKLLLNYDSYRQKLNYKNGPVRQIDMLTRYCKKKKKLPFYIFYSPADTATITKCKKTKSSLLNTSLFITDAYTVNGIISRNKGRQLSKNKILSSTNPFSCLFCCPFTFRGELLHYFLNKYFSKLHINDNYNDYDALPEYVEKILFDENLDVDLLIKENGLEKFRQIGVIDLRYDN